MSDIPRRSDAPWEQHNPTWKDLVRIGANNLLDKIAKEHGILFAKSILDKTRNPRIVLARDHFLALVRWSTTLSLPEMAFIFRMDHTSILSAIRRHENLLNGQNRYDEEKRQASKVRWAMK